VQAEAENGRTVRNENVTLSDTDQQVLDLLGRRHASEMSRRAAGLEIARAGRRARRDAKRLTIEALGLDWEGLRGRIRSANEPVSSWSHLVGTVPALAWLGGIISH